MTHQPDAMTSTASIYQEYYDATDTNASPCSHDDAKSLAGLLLPTLYAIVFLAGSIGNVLVVWVMIGKRPKLTATDVFLLNLALADLLFLSTLPFWAHLARDQWIFGLFMCRCVTGLYQLGFYSGVFLMVLMTLDRYVIIVHARSILARNRSARAGVSVCGVAWTMSLCASLPNIIFARVEDAASRLSCLPDYPHRAWTSFSFLRLNVLSFLLPLLVMTFCYCRIITTLLAIRSHRKHQVVKVVLAVVAVYFLFWTPYNLVVFLMFLHERGFLLTCDWSRRLSLAIQWAESVAFCHCCLNPVIYAFVGQKFRRTVLEVFRRQFPGCFGRCAAVSQHLFERKSSVLSRSSAECSSTL